MPERASYSPVAAPGSLEEYVRLQNTRLPRLATLLARVQRANSRVVTADTTIVESDDLVIADTTSGSVTVNLPDAEQSFGQVVAVKKWVAGNTMTLDAAGTDLIDGAGTLAVTTAKQTVILQAAKTAEPATFGWARLT